jgi:hypothetical protein
MTSLHQRLDQEHVHERESTVEKLQSRWSSSYRDIVDIPPSQPLSRRQMGGRPSSGSVKESHHKGLYTGNSQRGSAVGRLQGRNSRWTSCSGVITDSPPLQPLSRHQSRRGSADGRVQRSNSRWTSGSGVITDRPLLPPLSPVAEEGPSILYVSLDCRACIKSLKSHGLERIRRRKRSDSRSTIFARPL